MIFLTALRNAHTFIKWYAFVSKYRGCLTGLQLTSFECDVKFNSSIMFLRFKKPMEHVCVQYIMFSKQILLHNHLRNDLLDPQKRVADSLFNGIQTGWNAQFQVLSSYMELLYIMKILQKFSLRMWCNICSKILKCTNHGMDLTQIAVILI